MACFPLSYNGKLLAAPGHDYQGACRSRWVPKIRRRRYLRLVTARWILLTLSPFHSIPCMEKHPKKCEHSNAFYAYIYIFPIYFHSSYKNQTANDGPCHTCFVGYTQTPKVSGSNPADPELNHLWRWAWKALHGFTIFTIHFGVICGYPAGILILKKTWKCVKIYVLLAMTSARCKMSRRLLWGASRLFIIVWYPECMALLPLQTIFANI